MTSKQPATMPKLAKAEGRDKIYGVQSERIIIFLGKFPLRWRTPRDTVSASISAAAFHHSIVLYLTYGFIIRSMSYLEGGLDLLSACSSFPYTSKSLDTSGFTSAATKIDPWLPSFNTLLSPPFKSLPRSSWCSWLGSLGWLRCSSEVSPRLFILRSRSWYWGLEARQSTRAFIWDHGEALSSLAMTPRSDQQCKFFHPRSAIEVFAETCPA